MIYSDIRAIPDAVKKLLPVDAQEVFRASANAASDNGANENEAIGIGWETVRKGWTRPTSGISKKWLKLPGVHRREAFGKDGPTASDVHVPGIAGAPGKKKKPKALEGFSIDEVVANEASPTVSKSNIETVVRTIMETTLGGVAKTDEPAELQTIERLGRIVKVDQSRKIAYGWANVITEKNCPVVDSQGDMIAPGELIRFTTDFMLDSRVGKTVHEGEQTHVVVHSMPMTYELAKAFGIDTPDEGWLVGVYIHDPDTLAKAVSGELAAFSIGGAGERVPVGA